MSDVDTRLLASVGALVETVTGRGAGTVAAHHRFVDDLDVDSLAMLELLELCRVRLGVPVADEATAQLVHVGDLVDYLRHHGG